MFVVEDGVAEPVGAGISETIKVRRESDLGALCQAVIKARVERDVLAALNSSPCSRRDLDPAEEFPAVESELIGIIGAERTVGVRGRGESQDGAKSPKSSTCAVRGNMS